jgi:hypothetical protein
MDTPDQHGALTPLAREPAAVASAGHALLISTLI